MISDRASGAVDEAFVWVWLPGAVDPVVAGRLFRDGARLAFNYGRSYLARPDAVALYEPELPLRPGTIAPEAGLSMAGCLRDAAPDAWGRRVILNRRMGLKGKAIDVDQLDELTYLLESGSDRPGALDFQASSSVYVARNAAPASLTQLMGAAEQVEKGVPLSPELGAALLHGSSIGGARPKAGVVDGDRKYIAKFSSSGDVFDVVRGEYIAMRLAAHAGLNVAPVRLQEALGKQVLLVERFDRSPTAEGWLRRQMVSALTLFGFDEMMARYASYEVLAELIRHRFHEPAANLRELFARLVFNVLCGNTDDHARNHAAFLGGEGLTLTPAYDICPQARAGNEAGQAMSIVGGDNKSRLDVCLRAAPSFLLSAGESQAIAEAQVEVIRARWSEVCDEAGLTDVDRALMWRRQFLNPYAFEGAPAPLARLGDLDA